jgi:hypothetical protein
LSLAGEHLGRDTHSVASALDEHAALLADREPETAAALRERAERIRLGEPLDGAVLSRLCERITG